MAAQYNVQLCVAALPSSESQGVRRGSEKVGLLCVASLYELGFGQDTVCVCLRSTLESISSERATVSQSSRQGSEKQYDNSELAS